MTQCGSTTLIDDLLECAFFSAYILSKKNNLINISGGHIMSDIARDYQAHLLAR
jgi:hypothetical protein